MVVLMLIGWLATIAVSYYAAGALLRRLDLW